MTGRGPRVRRLAAAGLVAGGSLAGALPAAGQYVDAGPSFPVGTASDAPDERSTAALVGGGLLGGAVGLVAGLYLGAVLADSGDPEDLEFLEGAVAGAAIGEGILLPLGVHVVNDRQGNAFASVAVSLGLAAAGVMAMEVAHWDPPWTPAIAVAVPVAQLAAAIAIERATAD